MGIATMARAWVPLEGATSSPGGMRPDRGCSRDASNATGTSRAATGKRYPRAERNVADVALAGPVNLFVGRGGSLRRGGFAGGGRGARRVLRHGRADAPGLVERAALFEELHHVELADLLFFAVRLEAVGDHRLAEGAARRDRLRLGLEELERALHVHAVLVLLLHPHLRAAGAAAQALLAASSPRPRRARRPGSTSGCRAGARRCRCSGRGNTSRGTRPCPRPSCGGRASSRRRGRAGSPCGG
jgi:hypothetical protein